MAKRNKQKVLVLLSLDPNYSLCSECNRLYNKTAMRQFVRKKNAGRSLMTIYTSLTCGKCQSFNNNLIKEYWTFLNKEFKNDNRLKRGG